jgi:EAL domain-containing protein (putative c-di-GMP-specific phosphodiesterase class I)
MILMVNQSALQELGKEGHSLKGKIFDLLIPETEWGHHKKLSQLRKGEINGQVQLEGLIITATGETRNISWLHTLFNPPSTPKEAFILTIGVVSSERAQHDQEIISLPSNVVNGLDNSQLFRHDLINESSAAWRQLLEQAIANDQFLLNYQPVWQSKTHILHHYECLIQLQQDDRLLMPEMFINHAEALGLAGEIDRMALKKALRNLRGSEDERNNQNYRLSIKLSENLFEDTGFYDDIVCFFKLYNINPARIIFTISEKTAEMMIRKLKALGCSVALDNFGVSLSSFNNLKDLTVDYVKISDSLLQQIDQNNDNQEFIKSLCCVAQSFGKQTIAKCVENDGDLITLEKLEIDLVQGSLIGKPESFN